MNQIIHKNTLWPLAVECIILLGLFVLRIFKLDQVGLFDYDSVRNYLTIQEISQGDFTHLFHHASPSFYLFFTPIYAIFQHFLALEYVNALIGVATVWLFARFFRQAWLLPFWAYLFLLAGMGSCPFLVVASRYFSIENLSLLLFGGILIYYHRHLQNHQAKDWGKLWILMAISFTINYKTLLLLPIILVIELLQNNRILKGKELIFIPIPFAVAGIIYSLLGAFVNIGLLNYARYFYVVAFVRDTNPEIEKSRFDWEVSYYLKYLFEFENLFLFLGIFLLLWLVKEKLIVEAKLFWQKWSFSVTANHLVLLISICLIGGFSIIEKAPRAILLLYPFLYGFAILGLVKIWKSGLYHILLTFCFLAYNGWMIQRNIYPYAATNYPQLVEYLEEKEIQKIQLSVGLGVVPFLEGTGIQWENSFSAKESIEKEQDWLLLDDYHQLVHLGDFDSLADSSPSYFKIPEPSLLSPYLYLEHCEYTDQSYEEAMNDWQMALSKSYHLNLIRLDH